jgi:hypothetical protein
MSFIDDADAWQNSKKEHLWIFDKLILSRHLGYTCGPTGLDVPFPGTYIVRPCVNLLGMGLDAKFVHLDKNTDHLPVGHFWCEVFTGRHISVDYKFNEPILVVEGLREEFDSPLWKFSEWRKVNDVNINFPKDLSYLFSEYEFINAEYIDGKVIELHFRQNPDFVYGNSVAIPVWDDVEINPPNGFKFVSSPDYRRKGFYIDSGV